MRTAHPDILECNQCSFKGTILFDVWLHASETGHMAFSCEHDGCEKKFSRLDTYRRHARSHNDDAKRHSCKYCKKYRGQNGFKRKDHLTQHLRNYHHIGEDEVKGSLSERGWCPKEGCSEARPASVSCGVHGVFASSVQWVKHMRTVHDESDFPCPRPGCDRINGKGYYRKADLRSHLRKVHGVDMEEDYYLRSLR